MSQPCERGAGINHDYETLFYDTILSIELTGMEIGTVLLQDINPPRELVRHSQHAPI
jgi:hypothetical protein